jgi:hypothetical protein
MKKLIVLFGIVFLVAVTFNSCGDKKAKEAEKVEVKQTPPPPPPPAPVALEDYALKELGNSSGEVLLVPPKNVKTKSGTVVAGTFESDWEVTKVEAILWKYAFKEVVIKCGSAQNIVISPAHLYGGYYKGDYYYGEYEPGEIITIKDSRAKYWIQTDDDVFVLDANKNYLEPRPEWKK